jgi:hypothetical protein
VAELRTATSGSVIRQPRWQFAINHPATYPGTGGGKGSDIIHIQRVQCLADAILQVIVGEIVAKGLGGGRKSVGYLDAFTRKGPVHLAE